MFSWNYGIIEGSGIIMNLKNGILKNSRSLSPKRKIILIVIGLFFVPCLPTWWLFGIVAGFLLISLGYALRLWFEEKKGIITSNGEFKVEYPQAIKVQK
jgi:hypothetical protein